MNGTKKQNGKPTKMQLIELSEGDSARVIAIDGGHGLHQQLTLRGLTEGRCFTLLSGRCGPVVIRIGTGTLVLGRGMARKIEVQKVYQ